MIKYISIIKTKVLSYNFFKPLPQSEYIISTINKKTKQKKIYRIEILYIFGIFFYLLSLRHINGMGMRCFHQDGVQCLFIIAKLVLCSSVFFGISIFLILLRYSKKIHLLYILYFFIFFISQ